MDMNRIIRRYSAFIPRWCQSSGGHVPDPHGEARAVEWLIGEDCVGIILLPEIRHRLMHELLGRPEPRLEIGAAVVKLNDHPFVERPVLGQSGFAALRELLHARSETHMFLTYHLIYPPGTRIITLSGKAPMPLLYKEMAPLPVTLVD